MPTYIHTYTRMTVYVELYYVHTDHTASTSIGPNAFTDTSAYTNSYTKYIILDKMFEFYE